MIYDKYVIDNKADIDHQIELVNLSEAAKNVAMNVDQEEYKNEIPMAPPGTKRVAIKPPEKKLSLAEKITKTALNTGIRFNIIDNLGFDNASLQMF